MTAEINFCAQCDIELCPEYFQDVHNPTMSEDDYFLYSDMSEMIREHLMIYGGVQ